MDSFYRTGVHTCVYDCSLPVVFSAPNVTLRQDKPYTFMITHKIYQGSAFDGKIK